MNMTFSLFVALSVVLGFKLNDVHQELAREKAINIYAVDQLNKMSLKAKALKDRVEELSGANEALIKHCRPCDVVKAVKATPLPPMKKVQA